jgi:hypothetical protein
MNGKKAKKLRAVAAMIKDAGHPGDITQIYKQLKNLKATNASKEKQSK